MSLATIWLQARWSVTVPQVCNVVVAPEGLTVRWEDDSKTLQSSVHLRSEVRIIDIKAAQQPCLLRCISLQACGSMRHAAASMFLAFACACSTFKCHQLKGTSSCFISIPQLFNHYQSPGIKQVFGVHFSQLVDTLSVFATSSDASLSLRYPGPDGELQLE